MYRKLIYNILKTILLLFSVSIILSADTLPTDDSVPRSENIGFADNSKETNDSQADESGLNKTRKPSFAKQYFQDFLLNSVENLKCFTEKIKTLRHYGVKLIVLLVSVTVILATIIFYFQKQDRVRFMTTTRLSVMDKEVQRACRLIERKFTDSSLTPEMVCDELVTGEAFLQALFKKELGMSIEEFTNQVRINRARILLNKNWEADADELVYETGFKDTEEFLITFNKITGVSYESFKNSIRMETENI
ncbi:MAG TPA: AraC family transcriptional regulator [Chitinispirillaceae bacterium]|nr:AraC family transcriptional regulator [Chitinispirillaceae bacterium]